MPHVTPLDLRAGKVLIGRDEKPEEIIGFSLQVRKRAGNTPEIVKYAERVKLNFNSDLATEVKALIYDLTFPHGTFTDKEIEDAIKARGAKPFCDRAESPDEYKDLIYHPGPGGGGEVHTCIRPLLQINKPTLLVFSTNIPDLTFGGEPITSVPKPPSAPSRRRPSTLPNPPLDPNCVNIRSWNGGRVLGWYSSYDHEQSGALGEFWYKLQFNLNTSPLNKLDPSKAKELATQMSGFFDPGNGTGGGNGFP